MKEAWLGLITDSSSDDILGYYPADRGLYQFPPLTATDQWRCLCKNSDLQAHCNCITMVTDWWDLEAGVQLRIHIRLIPRFTARQDRFIYLLHRIYKQQSTRLTRRSLSAPLLITNLTAARHSPQHSCGSKIKSPRSSRCVSQQITT